MTDKTMTLEPCPFCGHTGPFDQWPCEWLDGSGDNAIRCPMCHGAAKATTWNRRHLPQPAERGEAVEFEYPEFHVQGMGCGLEDRGITDRYEAMRYGFDEALDQMARILEDLGPLYTAPPPAAAVPDALEQLREERWKLLNSFGNGPFADGRVRDRIAEIDAEIAAAPSDGGEQGERHE